MPAHPNADTWVVVPTYNEGPVVGGVLRELLATLPNVVAVDDGSSDNSSAEIVGSGARLVRHPINLGAGAALESGLQFALLDPTARYFVTFDADGQHRVADAAAMVAKLRLGEQDILLGSRFLGTSEGMPRARRLMLHAARVFETLSSGISLTDAHNGLRAFNRTFAEKVRFRMRDMAHASEMLRLIKSTGVRWAEQPVTVLYTDYSRGKGQRSINSVNIAVDVWLNHLLEERKR